MQPISISLGDEEIPCEMQLEIEHLTLDEAIASGLFDLPDEPGTVQIPVTVHVTIPNHLLWPPLPPTLTPEPQPQRTAGPGWGHVPVGGSARLRFGNYPKAVAAQRIAESIRSTLGFYGNEEAAAFRAMLATVNDGRCHAASPEGRNPDNGAGSDRPPSTPDGTPVELARDEAGPVEDKPGETSPAAAAEPEFENVPERLEMLRPDALPVENIPYPPAAGPSRPAMPGPGAEAPVITIEPGLQSPFETEQRAGTVGAGGLARSRLPSFRAGESDGGPGVWVRESPKYPYSNPKAAAYQQRATGAPVGWEYLLTEVPTRFMKLGKKYFDGYDPESNTLIDAKDYAGWPKEELAFSMEDMARDLANEAELAKHFGCVLELRVATSEKAGLLRRIIKMNSIENIVVRNVSAE